MADVKPIPEGYPQLSPYIFVDDAAAAIDFYTRIFGATERMRMPMGDKIVHAEVEIGDSLLMLSDEVPEMDAVGPKTVGGSPLLLSVYVDDVDAVVAAALAAGATEERPIEDRFYGDRVGSVVDPFGYRWSIATHVEDVPPDEMAKRMAAMEEQMGGAGS